MSNTPNFFIVGGPKCGTTAISEYLRAHPDIFLSEPKEPNFLADDMPGMKFVTNKKDYLNLFRKATSKKIIGEASIFYMFSKIAIENIFKLNPNAKLLVMLRNPLEMVPSYHQQILFTLDENEEDFNTAIDLELSRKNEKNIPKRCRAKKLLYYSEIAKYGDQLENIFKYFSRDKVKIVLFDEFKKNNRNIYLEILDFLELKDDGRIDFPRVNEAKKAKSKLINTIVNRPPKFAKSLAVIARKTLNKPRLGILNTLYRLNIDKLEKEPMSPQERKKLLNIYKDDIMKTQNILKADLSTWYS